MRVLCVSTWFPYPPDNGSKRRAYALMRELARAHELTIVTFAEPGEAEHGRMGLESIGRLAGVVPGNPAKAPSPLPKAAWLSSWPRSLAAGYSDAMQALVREHITRHDAVVAFQPGSALYLLAPRRVPAVFDEPELTVLRDRFEREPRALARARRGLTWWKHGRFLRRLVRAAERTTVASEHERTQLIRIGCPAERLVIVENGADPAPSSTIARVEHDTLVYPGALTYDANLDAVTWFLSDIWPRILQARPSARLVVTGTTEGVELDTLPPRPRTTFTGHVDSIASILAGAAAVIVPLRIGGGTRVKVLETLAAGTPVVGTSKAFQGLELTPELDVLVADTADAFARQVCRVLEDPLLRSRMGARGRRTVEDRYSWTRAGEQLRRVVEGIAASRVEGVRV
jgi:glycosyltransferase involved in cell wall biosynthesis